MKLDLSTKDTSDSTDVMEKVLGWIDWKGLARINGEGNVSIVVDGEENVSICGAATVGIIVVGIKGAISPVTIQDMIANNGVYFDPSQELTLGLHHTE